MFNQTSSYFTVTFSESPIFRHLEQVGYGNMPCLVNCTAGICFKMDNDKGLCIQGVWQDREDSMAKHVLYAVTLMLYEQLLLAIVDPKEPDKAVPAFI